MTSLQIFSQKCIYLIVSFLLKWAYFFPYTTFLTIYIATSIKQLNHKQRNGMHQQIQKPFHGMVPIATHLSASLLWNFQRFGIRVERKESERCLSLNLHVLIVKILAFVAETIDLVAIVELMSRSSILMLYLG